MIDKERKKWMKKKWMKEQILQFLKSVAMSSAKCRSNASHSMCCELFSKSVLKDGVSLSNEITHSVLSVF